MMTLTLRVNTEYASLELPTSVAEAHKVISAMIPGPVVIEDVSGPIRNLAKYIRRANMESESDVQSLNSLAGKIGGMSGTEHQLFSGALDAESVNGLDDILRIANSLDSYELIEGVSSDRELGGWLVENGHLDVDFPESVRPYLDYVGIGAEYYADHGGAYTLAGYVKRREASQEQAVRTRPTLITIHMNTLEAPGTPSKTCCLQLPATDRELENAKAKLYVDSFADAYISRIEFGKPYLEELIPQDCFCVEDANELALGMEEMLQKDGEFMKFLAVLSVEQPETLAGALRLAMDIDNYERIPEDMSEYGEQVLRRIGADSEIIDTINGYMDFAKLGEDSMADDGIRRTEFGLIRRLSSPFPEQEIGQTMM